MRRWTPEDERHMRRALELAIQGQGRVEPNPMVGCVIVKNNRVVGEGHHQAFGQAHAEVNALRAAGSRARGATIYVTLEPCSHFGKTPPCADALIRAQVARVIVAMRDPNPIVSGNGLKRLRAAGIKISVGLCKRDAETINAPFIIRHREHRPWVILKWAQSIDGKIATRTGDSRWITSRQSRTEAHRLRARVDGIVVGAGTVLADDPDLTARHVRPKRVATRIVLDSDLRLPRNARLVRSAKRAPTLIVTTVSPQRLMSKQTQLRRAGCEILSLPKTASGIDLRRLLEHLSEQGMTNIMVEGGGRVLGSFVEQKLADEAWVFVAPKLIGGENAPGPLCCAGPATMSDLPQASVVGTAHFGPDLWYNLRFDQNLRR